MNDLADQLTAEGWINVGLTNAPADQNQTFKDEHEVSYSMITCDQTELKIIVRSNPGIVWIKDGVVQEKWAWKDVPEASELLNP